jgi:hypothetical protein
MPDRRALSHRMQMRQDDLLVLTQRQWAEEVLHASQA